jgi:hypothetical protein
MKSRNPMVAPRSGSQVVVISGQEFLRAFPVLIAGKVTSTTLRLREIVIILIAFRLTGDPALL